MSCQTLKLEPLKLEYISSLYEISYTEANDYLNLKPEGWFDEILEMYGLDKKEKSKIKKLK